VIVVQMPISSSPGVRIERLSIGSEIDGVESLQQANEHEGYFVIRELLPETDTRSGVERQKYERVRRRIL